MALHVDHSSPYNYVPPPKVRGGGRGQTDFSANPVGVSICVQVLVSMISF